MKEATAFESGEADWSPEAVTLQNECFKSPWKVTKDFKRAHFRSISIVDKNVKLLGEGMKVFRNLNELSIMGNRFTSVNGSHLPESIEMLHVSANQLTDLTSLHSAPVGLAHLGIAYNLLETFSPTQMPPNCFAGLISLDLGYNQLRDLKTTVATLKNLPKLVVLNAAGNPFCLLPWYRGYVVDSMKPLEHLDEVRIRRPERAALAGLALEELESVSMISVTVEEINGLADPDPEATRALLEGVELEIDPEAPAIKRTYQVSFAFPGEMHEVESNVGEIRNVLEDMFKHATVQKKKGKRQTDVRPQLTQKQFNKLVEVKQLKELLEKYPLKEFDINEDGETTVQELFETLDKDKNGSISVAEFLSVFPTELFDLSAKDPGVYTPPQLWAEKIKIASEFRFLSRDIAGLAKICSEGIVFEIFETTVSSVVAPSEDDDDPKNPKKKPKKGSEVEIKRIELPAIIRHVGVCVVPIDALLEGKDCIKSQAYPVEDPSTGKNLCGYVKPPVSSEQEAGGKATGRGKDNAPLPGADEDLIDQKEQEKPLPVTLTVMIELPRRLSRVDAVGLKKL